MTPTRRELLGAATMAAAVPVAPVLALPAVPGIRFYVVAWEAMGGLVGVGRSEAEAWTLAHEELRESWRETATPDQDPDEEAAGTFAVCRAEAPCVAVEARDEQEAWTALTSFGGRRPRSVLRIWRRAFPAAGDVDPILADLEAEEEAKRQREEEQRHEAETYEESWTAEARRTAAEEGAARLAALRARDPEAADRHEALVGIADAIGRESASPTVPTAVLQRVVAMLGAG